MLVTANISGLYMIVLDHKCNTRKFWDGSSKTCKVTGRVEIQNPIIDLTFFSKTTLAIIVSSKNQCGDLSIYATKNDIKIFQSCRCSRVRV
jgi:hypothetical protein